MLDRLTNQHTIERVSVQGRKSKKAQDRVLFHGERVNGMPVPLLGNKSIRVSGQGEFPKGGFQHDFPNRY